VGVRSITYSATGSHSIALSTVASHTATVQVSVEGKTTLIYFATNTAGVSSARQMITVMVDETPPTTRAITSTTPISGWYPGRQSVNVTLTATDAVSGVDSTYYGLDNPVCLSESAARCTEYRTPIAVSGDGVHTLTIFSKDRAGNVEPTRRMQVAIDARPPVTSVKSAYPLVTLQAIDPMPGSGVDVISYQWVNCPPGPGSPVACSPNPTAWKRYDESSPLQPQGCGVHLFIFSTDKVDNRENSHDLGHFSCIQ
jgi:hypothetical protein